MSHLSSPNVAVDRDAASLSTATFGGIIPISGHTKLWLCDAQAFALIIWIYGPKSPPSWNSLLLYPIQLKLQTLESWCRQQQKLGNLPASADDQHQIVREDHDLGIDAFVAIKP